VTIKALSEVTFSITAGDDQPAEVFKISKGEESNFIWSIFYTLLETVVTVLNVPEVEDRETDQFNGLQYVFIDDPVSSLDENHLIELAVNLAELITAAPAQLRFVITTHSPLFYNVLHNELDLKKKPAKEGCYLLERLADGTFNLNTKYGDSNKSFSYHLHLRKILELAIAEDKIERYHFTLLRNLYEKTAGFLGHNQWGDLLNSAEGSKEAYVRVINTFSHSSLSTEQVRDPTPQERQTVKLLLDNLVSNYGYWREDAQNG
jgi:wobble nucleotide-excising tRNase